MKYVITIDNKCERCPEMNIFYDKDFDTLRCTCSSEFSCPYGVKEVADIKHCDPLTGAILEEIKSTKDSRGRRRRR